MCTVSWWYGEDGAYSVFFNRDERRTRTRSEPVAPRTTETGMPFLAPRDPVGGGTWLVVNAAGVSVGVLNNYAAQTERLGKPVRSRGELPLTFVGARSGASVAATLDRLSPADFAPFFLLIWDELFVVGWSWDGVALAPMNPITAPVTTSSFRTEEVCGWRRRRYAEVVRGGTPEELVSYQDDAAHSDPAFNVRMRRPDACTESVCRIDVTRTEVRFRHRREDPEALRARDEHACRLNRG